jgi:hypothetical protein
VRGSRRARRSTGVIGTPLREARVFGARVAGVGAAGAQRCRRAAESAPSRVAADLPAHLEDQP